MRLLARTCSLLLPLVLLVACATAPVQEMSDARQAIQAARAVARQPAEQEQIDAAARQLHEAEAALEARRYDDARRMANAARAAAIAVRERAERPGGG